MEDKDKPNQADIADNDATVTAADDAKPILSENSDSTVISQPYFNFF